MCSERVISLSVIIPKGVTPMKRSGVDRMAINTKGNFTSQSLPLLFTYLLSMFTVVHVGDAEFYIHSHDVMQCCHDAVCKMGSSIWFNREGKPPEAEHVVQQQDSDCCDCVIGCWGGTQLILRWYKWQWGGVCFLVKIWGVVQFSRFGGETMAM